MVYVLAAATAAVPVRKPTMMVIQTAENVFGVKISTGNSSADITLLIALKGKSITWQHVTYNSKALIIRTKGGKKKIIEMGSGF